MAIPYWEWVKEEAELVGSDGCSWVSELYQVCCYEHDLAYRYGKDPRQAYLKDWTRAGFIDRAEADRRFRDCIRAHSALGAFSPLAFVRWIGVRIGGWWAWKH